MGKFQMLSFKELAPLKKQKYGLKGREYWRSYNRISSKYIHAYYMRQAIDQAKEAGRRGEVPVGAVLVKNYSQLVYQAGNQVENLNNGMKHAEMLCLEEASKDQGRYLQNMTLYVTLEPCLMCAGAMVNMRLGRLVYGATDKERGAYSTVVFGNSLPKSLHKPKIISGIYEDECGQMLKDFFQEKRKKSNRKK